MSIYHHEISCIERDLKCMLLNKIAFEILVLAARFRDSEKN